MMISSSPIRAQEREFNALKLVAEEYKQRINAMLQAQHEPIAVVGVGLNFPGGCVSLSHLNQLLRDHGSATSPLPTSRWQDEKCMASVATDAGGFIDHHDAFDARFFSISPKDARYMDPQQRIALQVAWHALEDAHIDPDRLVGTPGAVFVGVGASDYAYRLSKRVASDYDSAMGTGLSLSAISGRISYFLGWHGPSMTLDTACSSSLVAIHQAMVSLRRTESDIALAGGVSVINHPMQHVVCSQANMLARDGACKTFDDSADGYGRSEGCAFLVLKRLSDAKKSGDRIHCLLRGSAVCQDGKRSALTVPNGQAQEMVMQKSLADAQLAPDQISYVEAHGTGTPLGDPIEMTAINHVFGENRDETKPLFVSSVKTNLGHMEAAAGVGGILKVIAQLREKRIYKHVHFHKPSTRIRWQDLNVTIPQSALPWNTTKNVALVNSFGFSGTIASVVVEEPPQYPLKSHLCTQRRLFTVSAKSLSSLANLLELYTECCDDEISSDFLTCTQLSRKHNDFRLMTYVEDLDTFKAYLSQIVSFLREGLPVADVGNSKKRPQPMLFAFYGEVFSNANSIISLCEEFQYFASLVDEVLVVALASHAPFDNAVDDDVFSRLDFANKTGVLEHILSFLMEYCSARFLQSVGVEPQIVIASREGMLAAAAFTDMLTLEQAMTVCLMNRQVTRQTYRKMDIQDANRAVYFNETGERVDHVFLAETVCSSFQPSQEDKRNINKKFNDFIPFYPGSFSLTNDAPVREAVNAVDKTLLVKQVLCVLGEVFRRGVNIDWAKVHAGINVTKTALPNYPFDKKTYWV